MKLPFRLIVSLVALMSVLSCGCLDLDLDCLSFVNPTVEPEKAKIQKALYGSYVLRDEDSSGTMMCHVGKAGDCLLYTSPSPRDQRGSRMPSSA